MSHLLLGRSYEKEVGPLSRKIGEFVSTLIHETNCNNEACNLVTAGNKIIQIACRQLKSWAHTQGFLQEPAASKLCQLLKNVLPTTFMEDIAGLHFPTVACKQALQSFGKLAHILFPTAKSFAVYFEETFPCLLENFITTLCSLWH